MKMPSYVNGGSRGPQQLDVGNFLPRDVAAPPIKDRINKFPKVFYNSALVSSTVFSDIERYTVQYCTVNVIDMFPAVCQSSNGLFLRSSLGNRIPRAIQPWENLLKIMETATDGKGHGQPACQKEWKKCEEETE
jgi:hypothetical protein